MLFKPEMIVALRNGSKTETRRVLKPGECIGIKHIDYTWPPEDYDPVMYLSENRDTWIVKVVKLLDKSVKWKVGNCYSIQPGYGNNGIGFFTMSFIRVERLHEITEAGAIAEGVANLQAYKDLWIAINGNKGRYGWDSNPLVAVLGIADVKWKE